MAFSEKDGIFAETNIEAWGRGYKKIREGFEGVGLPMPKIESAYGGVRVTFQRNNVNTGQSNVLGNRETISATQLSELQVKIVSHLIQTGQWNVLENVLETSATLAALFNVDPRTIRRDLNILQSKGVIRRDGPDRGGRRVILKKMEP